MTNISEIQEALGRSGLDGWLFYDFLNRDPIAYRILGIDGLRHTSRRWFYYIPAVGEPRRLVHSVEPDRLDGLPGEKIVYLSWQEQHARLKELLAGARKVAMQYSPNNDIPYISMVDAGTVELIRGFGPEVVTSADLVQRFEALVSPEAYQTHVAAGESMHAILRDTWQEIARRIEQGQQPTEYEIQQFMLEGYRANRLAWDEMPPIVAVNAHAGNPHFEPTPEGAAPIKPGDLLLIDLWARKDEPGAIYYDITWCAVVGEGPIPSKYQEIFQVVVEARDKAVAFIAERLGQDSELYGWEVDRACRDHIESAGYGKYFVHRTGHSIGADVHGNGAHIDNLETPDTRRIVPGLLFSIEPGIYLPDMGVRTEIDVYIDDTPKPVIYGPIQQELVRVS